MNIRQRLTLDAHLQREHNEIAHRGDRAVFIVAVLIAVAMAAGWIA